MDKDLLLEDLKRVKNPVYRKQIENMVLSKVIPEDYPKEISVLFSFEYNIMGYRDAYTKYCSWCLVSKSWIRILAELLRGKKCIEIMAGKGLISYALQQEGVNIKASDDCSWGTPVKYTDVETKDAVEAIRDEKELDYVLCSWPPYDEYDICEVAKIMALKHPKAKLIYIGEEYGCNAPDEFFNIVSLCEGKDGKIVERANERFMQFGGIHDYIALYKPNSKAKKFDKKQVESNDYDDII